MFRSPARLFAPLALVACAVAVLVIVNGHSSSGGSKTPAATTSSTATFTKKTKPHRRTYIVKTGDVLSRISIKTGVPLVTLQQLNPNVDAQSLHVGQKLKLEP
jgi:LysM repeat protein